jgi:shikimate dehydrogenase
MKKYMVIGNPIDHSLSPKLHNYWIKQHKIEAIYEKKKLDEKDLKEIVSEVKNDKINGINITTPFKKTVIPFLDKLTQLADETQSVNTIYKQDNIIVGHNTDVGGFELSLKYINYDVKNKNIMILGAGGVTPSIIIALKNMEASKIFLCNRTKEKAEILKKRYPYVEVINWGEIPNFNMIVNTTSVGLKKNDEINLNYKDIGSDKLFYDLIYNPKQTNFLLKAKKFGNKVQNGKMMFIYQAHQAFTIWHKTIVNIDEQTIELLD